MRGRPRAERNRGVGHADLESVDAGGVRGNVGVVLDTDEWLTISFVAPTCASPLDATHCR